MASRVMANDRNDHLLLPPESDEVGPYETPLPRNIVSSSTSVQTMHLLIVLCRASRRICILISLLGEQQFAKCYFDHRLIIVILGSEYRISARSPLCLMHKQIETEDCVTNFIILSVGPYSRRTMAITGGSFLRDPANGT